jgi:hypothetical protein
MHSDTKLKKVGGGYHEPLQKYLKGWKLLQRASFSAILNGSRSPPIPSIKHYIVQAGTKLKKVGGMSHYRNYLEG